VKPFLSQEKIKDLRSSAITVLLCINNTMQIDLRFNKSGPTRAKKEASVTHPFWLSDRKVQDGWISSAHDTKQTPPAGAGPAPAPQAPNRRKQRLV
jgi:hypothetical protein